jgi:hypothetical protein
LAGGWVRRHLCELLSALFQGDSSAVLCQPATVAGFVYLKFALGPDAPLFSGEESCEQDNVAGFILI